jgi:hypothetical protein
MKRNIFLLLILCSIGVFTATIGCRRSIVTPNNQTLILGKWTMNTAQGHYVTAGVTRDETTTFKPADYFEFRADGTVTIVENGITYNGKWKIDGSSKIIFSETNYIDTVTGFTIKTLTASNLQLFKVETAGSDVSQFTLNFSR